MITTIEGIYGHFDNAKHKTTINRQSDYLSNKTENDKNWNVITKEVEKLKKYLCNL